MEYPSGEPTPEDVYFKNELIEALYRSLNELSPVDKEIIELSYFKGMDDSEIGRTLKMKRSTVQARRSKAVEELRYMLKDYV